MVEGVADELGPWPSSAGVGDADVPRDDISDDGSDETIDESFDDRGRGPPGRDRRRADMETVTPAMPVGDDGGWRAGSGHGDDPGRHVHIVVLGPAGIGAASRGRLLANELQRPFVDSDAIVTLHCGRSPAEIALTEDVAAIRKAELDALGRVLATHASVVFAAGPHASACVGRADLGDAFVVWLDAASPAAAGQRRGDESFPGSGASVDLRLEVDRSDPHATVERILREWHDFAAGSVARQAPRASSGR
jgi:hypothetical protein